MTCAGQEILKKHPGTFFVNNELNTYKSDVKIKIDKEKARILGVLTSDVVIKQVSTINYK